VRSERDAVWLNDLLSNARANAAACAIADIARSTAGEAVT
jgi:hypothetical protein